MKKTVFIFISLLVITTTAYSKQNKKHPLPSSFAHNTVSNAVTYEFSGGRFGDSLLAYIHAKWIAYRYQIPVLYKPFDYSDQLVLHHVEREYDPRMISNFKTRMTLGKGQGVLPGSHSVLYNVPYFPHSAYELCVCNKRDNSNFPYFHMDYEDPEFKAELRKLIKPLSELSKPEIPKDCITVALHMRRGLAFDGPDLKITTPFKEPPLSYYLNQIRILSNLYRDGPLYVHLFTDDLEPEKILDTLKTELADLNIFFTTRMSGNNHNSNVLEDFFAMLDFDCLIRPESNYSICAEILGDFKAVCSIEYIQKENNLPYVSKSRLVIKE